MVKKHLTDSSQESSDKLKNFKLHFTSINPWRVNLFTTIVSIKGGDLLHTAVFQLLWYKLEILTWATPFLMITIGDAFECVI